MPSRKTILVLHLAGQYPLAGVVWQALHYLVGLRQLGHDVYYVEDSGAPPYDPRVKSIVEDPTYNVSCLQQTLERFGFGERWVYWDMASDTYFGHSRAQLDGWYEKADLILNLCGASWPRSDRRRGGPLVYIQTDPVYEQILASQGDQRMTEMLSAHDLRFTYGENLGAADCPIPLGGFTWKTTRPPVVLDLWAPRIDPSCRYFTTVATWHNKGKDITFQGEKYVWSKHVNFLKYLELPQRTPQAFELAVETGDEAIRSELTSLGWRLAQAAERSATVEGYQEYIYASRGEFTVAKDIYARPRSGWFSDRTVCYLAAGKPVVTQETGFSKFVPVGRGLFSFSNMDEAVAAFAAINADYLLHARAAREVAEQYFGAETILRKLLHDANVI